MKLHKLNLLVTLLVLHGTQRTVFAQQNISPEVTRKIDPETSRDPQLETAIFSAIYGDRTAEESDDVRYYYNRVDLNGDEKPEVLVFVFGRDMCGTGGCGALVFRSRGQKYELVTDISLARNPIIVSQQKTRGWNDLVLFVAGGGIIPGYYAVLRFNGRSYPENPTTELAQPLTESVKGEAYLNGSYSPSVGIPLLRRRAG